MCCCHYQHHSVISTVVQSVPAARLPTKHNYHSINHHSPLHMPTCHLAVVTISDLTTLLQWAEASYTLQPTSIHNASVCQLPHINALLWAMVHSRKGHYKWAITTTTTYIKTKVLRRYSFSPTAHQLLGSTAGMCLNMVEVCDIQGNLTCDCQDWGSTTRPIICTLTNKQ